MLSLNKCLTLPIILFTFLVAAQSSKDERTCPYSIQSHNPESTINSSGTALLPAWQNSVASGTWNMILTFNDSGQRSTQFGRFLNPLTGRLQGYLTYPRFFQGGQLCGYMYSPLNASSTGDTPGTSCQGVLSEDCIKALVAAEATLPTGPRCGQAPWNDDIKKVCPVEIGGIAWTTNPVDLRNKTCALTSIAGNVSIGDDSFAVPVMGQGSGPVRATEEGMSDFTYYDRIVRQPIPFLLSLNVDGKRASQVVCIAPQNVQQGSRVPEGEWPPEGGATGADGNNDDTKQGNGNAASTMIHGVAGTWIVAFVCIVATFVL